MLCTNCQNPIAQDFYYDKLVIGNTTTYVMSLVGEAVAGTVLCIACGDVEQSCGIPKLLERLQKSHEWVNRNASRRA
jgi:hypothetical protein